ncbi:hypothetical protein B0H13DRAFT_2305220 [Mycena leptocephala]|nr:hypothetical protein B0H13DRAFT_2305220 [Mycena leptocephala]
MSSQRFPNELWLEVFSHLPRDTLKAVSLAYRTFHRLSRPALFRDFKFHPYAVHIDSGGALAGLPPSADVNRSLERLNFWCSDEIAPFVRICRIIPWYPFFSNSRLVFSTTDTPYTLLYALFERVPCFTGLKRLFAEHAHFTQTGVTNVCRLPTLSRLDLVLCSVAPGEHIDPSTLGLGVSSCLLKPYIHSQDGFDPWVRLLRPEHLRQFQMSYNSRFFSERLHTTPSFPHVHTLSAKIDFSKMSQILMSLSKFPAVEVLTLAGWGTLPLGLQASGVLPLVRDYTGCTQALPFFLPLSTLRRIKTTDELSANYFISQLRGLQPAPNITSLDVRFTTHFNNATLDTICAFFAQLTELRIHIFLELEDEFEDGVNPYATSFLRKLAVNPTLPPTLKCLTLRWRFHSDLPCGRGPSFATLRAAVLACFPHLTSVWIDGEDFLLSWNRWSDGTEVGRIAHNRAAVDAMRKEIMK